MSHCRNPVYLSRDDVRRVLPASTMRRVERQFQTFMHRRPARWITRQYRYPSEMELWGHATVTSYRSDKFDGVWADYRHDHDGELHPEILVARSHGRPLWEKSRRPEALQIMGFALDIQYYRSLNDHDRFLDFKGRNQLSLLCGDGSPHRLYVVPCNPDAGSVFLLTSPDMEIRDVGITR